ncbi:hypothetical protein ACMZID_004372 [Salmonella enterica subsp. enterica serovar Brandenburg]|nr:hypothetical protein [Salmonella enterica]EDW9075440.1 hypothetical protein [Salmonella enterica subsp. enterica serovar 4,[5],12:i:-]EGK3006488.1 hypothetical protein [Salmonella enterica subsp. enterica serovar Kentucky]EJT0790997.1 hypothetical protein [Salmonella enterica subsp. enterica serovar Kentucky]
MLMFAFGFAVAAFIAICFYGFVKIGVRACLNDNELALAIYKNKDDVWKITRNFEKIADEIAFRRKFGKPGSIKYID